jgi:L-rhamnose-H+ transport protein
MNELLFPIFLVVCASIFQGTFGIGMKYIKPLSWEAWWIIYSVVAMILFPIIWGLLVVPDLFGVISSAPSSALIKGMTFGFLWGIGGIMFGVSVSNIGVSITYGIVMGLASAVGSIVPLFQIQGFSSKPAFPYIIIGVVVMLIGVFISGVAGVKRDKAQGAAGNQIEGMKQGKAFRTGLIIAISSGVLSALLNVGFANALPIAKMAEEGGTLTRNSSLAAWVVVLFGAFIMNAGYSFILLFRNKSWSSFTVEKSGKAYLWSVLTGLFWFGALGVYGQGAALMGQIGPVVGWPMLLGLALIISNVWAFFAGEWKGAIKPFRIMLISVGILIIACIILGYSNSINIK